MTRRAGCGGGAGLNWQQRADVVVIGTGVAGLAAALAASRSGSRTVVLSKAQDTATHYAQGGIAVVLPETDDSIADHVRDTVAAGAGLCDLEAVQSIVADGYQSVMSLVGEGARFDLADSGGWALTREGGHSRRRIVHAGGDATGAEVQRALDQAARTLDIRRDHVGLEILHDGSTVTGVSVRNADGFGVIHAPAVVVATGGLGHLYRATTNPEGSTGDGIALALWAGLTVTDIEFVQFHPTMLFDRRATGRRPLVTEALRGEGAVLRDARGDSVTAGVHPMGDLAPRDVVAAAIEARLRDTGDECVYLDARAVERLAERFPTVTAACHSAGIDPTRQPIPIVPGAHYSCGGIRTDAYGRTELPGFLAAGEVARTGMHGANRLASNSLLEGLVVGGRAGRAAAEHARVIGTRVIAKCGLRQRDTVDRAVLQRAMTRWASLNRDHIGLSELAEALDGSRATTAGDRPAFEDAALTVTARAVAAAADTRTESRGCHHRRDHPSVDAAQAASVPIAMGADGRLRMAEPVMGVAVTR
jgi:L-aspartate oxidase